ncbi:DUF2290 domain-containing protein [Exiguobacterium acetylicum]|uniref:DUF2290 domain-containing protein n=1 Tax=Exiguobacterium acetylicum TaxID=41170 RepID=UPI001CA67A27|nr:DUF2290 domain-containing protein [Exiguobacterium acetylicum]QZY88558.1 DUF2290 domain-containing protein [Exiguobacterium acetylicum]
MSISLGKLKTEFLFAKKTLQLMDIEYEENLQKSKNLLNSDFSQDFKHASLKKDYYNTYKIARDNQDYTLLLKDFSFFQFGYTLSKDSRIEELRYAYYETPSMVEKYEVFLENMGFTLEEVGNEFFEEYQQFVSEAQLKNHVTSIRYDFSIEQGQELVHPTSHLHIGQENDVRIPMSFIMTPQTFVAFVIRHCYWIQWKEKIKDPEIRDFYLKIHDNNHVLTSHFFTMMEKKDIHF